MKNKKIVQGEDDEDDEVYDYESNNGATTTTTTTITSSSSLSSLTTTNTNDVVDIVQQQQQQQQEQEQPVNRDINTMTPTTIHTSLSSLHIKDENDISSSPSQNSLENSSTSIVGETTSNIPVNLNNHNHNNNNNNTTTQQPKQQQQHYTRISLSLGENKLKEYNESFRKQYCSKTHYLYYFINKELVNANNNLSHTMDLAKSIQHNIRQFNDDILSLEERLEQTEWSLQC
ncbi:hypothetical protein CYY_001853 [Polysphondylium violaceum]|uniref:Biogenesis of lysosome-related organelles complex 1 subunit 3 n=1 Tax=Polysphondylium violaceum TaxID=133409 RepID=A0A8J4Q0R1_9MYCE|nr:hypothetical protein CYY_001853 [Polysphondylium violaceum]